MTENRATAAHRQRLNQRFCPEFEVIVFRCGYCNDRMDSRKLCSSKLSFGMKIFSLTWRGLVVCIVPFATGLHFIRLRENKQKTLWCSSRAQQFAVTAQVIFPGTVVSLQRPDNQVQLRGPCPVQSTILPVGFRGFGNAGKIGNMKRSWTTGNLITVNAPRAAPDGVNTGGGAD